MLNKQTVQIWNFPNAGYITDTVPQDIFEAIKKETDVVYENFATADPFNKTLVGHIDKEFDLMKPDLVRHVEPYLQELTKAYQEVFRYPQLRSQLVSFWVNYQEKYEFNPIHDHEAHLSFVIWVKIPFDRTEEAKVFNKSNEKPVNGQFHFVYTDVFGRTNTFTPREEEGMIAIFDSRIQHMVYPFFTSDEYRVSVAGNLMFTR